MLFVFIDVHPFVVAEKRGRIYAFFSQFLEFRHYDRLVFLECHAEPLARGVLDFASRFSGFDEPVHDGRYVEFGFEFI